MPNTTNYNMRQLAQGDLQPWVTVNTNDTTVDARLAVLDHFGPRNITNLDANGALTANLSYGYMGGMIRRGATVVVIGAGSVTCTASQTNYVEMSFEDGTVSANITGFTSGRYPLATVVCDATKKTSVNDRRTWIEAPRDNRLSKSVAGGVDVTLSNAEGAHQIIELTGALTANINVIVPAISRQWTVANKTSGAFTLTVKGASGTGVAVTQNMRCIVYHDGVNIVRVTADV